jgi:hypothetical protein
MPQTVFDVGDPITSRLTLGVTPDGSTTVTVTVTRPDGTVIAGLVPGAWSGTNGDEKTVQWFATNTGAAGAATDSAAGDWLAVWQVGGTGASVVAKVYPVAPLPGNATRVPWSPFLSDVADHVPWLTTSVIAPGSQTYLGTFTGNTSPTDEQAQRHINSAVAFISARFSTLTAAMYPLARAVAAMWAAATLARAFARSADDRAAADALERLATRELETLTEVADEAGATPLSPQPVLIAPLPVPWGDDLLVDSSYPGAVRWVIQ